jgi:hypothetical protein
MTRYDRKLASIRAGNYKRTDFMIADAKDGDMGAPITAMGPHRRPDGTPVRNRTRREFLDGIEAILRQDILDIMLVSASNLEALTLAGHFRESAIKPAIRANDATDCWGVRHARYASLPSRAFRSVSLPRMMGGKGGSGEGMAPRLTDLGLYSITFNNDLDADLRSLDAFSQFREDAARVGFKYFLEVFNPNVDAGLTGEQVGEFVNDCVARCLAGVIQADRPQFLKIVYNGPKALDELVSYDPSLVVGVLGGAAGTTRDTFELICQAERYGARVALFGRRINLAESQLDMIGCLRRVADGDMQPAEAVKAYHAALAKQGMKPTRPLEDDLLITQPALKAAATA